MGERALVAHVPRSETFVCQSLCDLMMVFANEFYDCGVFGEYFPLEFPGLQVELDTLSLECATLIESP